MVFFRYSCLPCTLLHTNYWWQVYLPECPLTAGTSLYLLPTHSSLCTKTQQWSVFPQNVYIIYVSFGSYTPVGSIKTISMGDMCIHTHHCLSPHSFQICSLSSENLLSDYSSLASDSSVCFSKCFHSQKCCACVNPAGSLHLLLGECIHTLNLISKAVPLIHSTPQLGLSYLNVCWVYLRGYMTDTSCSLFLVFSFPSKRDLKPSMSEPW